MSRIIKEYITAHASMTYESGDHVMYVIKSDDLIELASDGTLKLWSRNRPVDEARVEEIREYISKTQHVDGSIRLAFIKGEGLVCYESNHRRMALIPGIPVMVDILWDVQTERVIEEFIHINRAVSVPELYTEVDMDATAKEKITEYVKDMASFKYKAFVSTSSRPNRPQFNRDVLTQEITKLWKDIGCPVDILLKSIDAVNDAYRDEKLGTDHTKIKSTKILEKCSKGGLWLFAFDTSLNKDHVEKVLLFQ
jgi:hypothetical protein